MDVMFKKDVTWEDLAAHINKMTDEERKKPVKIQREEQPICNDVCIVVNDDDVCYDPDDPYREYFLRGQYAGDAGDKLRIVVAKGESYLYISD